MLTLLSERTDAIQRFRAAPWQFQQTFCTPLKDLKRFVSVFLAPFSVKEGVISTDEVVFEPRNVLKLLAKQSIAVDNCYRFTIEATSSSDVALLLETVLSDWIDFIFLPKPKSFAIYADHDEFTTFYTPKRGALSRLKSGLEEAGFEAVPDYTRGSSGSKWR
jgi:hypothetical protein